MTNARYDHFEGFAKLFLDILRQTVLHNENTLGRIHKTYLRI